MNVFCGETKHIEKNMERSSMGHILLVIIVSSTVTDQYGKRNTFLKLRVSLAKRVLVLLRPKV